MACSYNLNELKPKVLFITKAMKDSLDIYIDARKWAYLEAEPDTYSTLSVKTTGYQEEASLDSRFTFSRQLTFTLEGYFNAATLYNYYSVMVVLPNNKKILLNFDHPYEVSYTYDGFETTVSLSILSDYPLLGFRKESDEIAGTSINTPDCHYLVGDYTSWEIEYFDAGTTTSGITVDDGKITDFQLELADGEFNVSLNIAVPLALSGVNDWQKVEYFNENKKDVILATPSGNIIHLYNLQSEYTIENTNITWQLTGMASMLKELVSVN